MVNKIYLATIFTCGLYCDCFCMDIFFDHVQKKAIDEVFFDTMCLDENDLEALRNQIYLYTDFFVGRYSNIDVNFMIPIISARFTALILKSGQQKHRGIRKICDEYSLWEDGLRELLCTVYLNQEPSFINIPDFIVQGYAVIPAYTLSVQEVKERVLKSLCEY